MTSLSILLKKSYPNLKHHDRGVALVIVLMAVLFITLLTVAFFSKATMSRSNSAAYVNAIKSEELANGGLEMVIDALRKEITDNNRSDEHSAGEGTTVYVPKSAEYIIPQRTESGTGNLVKSSRYNQPFYTGGESFASEVSSDTISKNGRSVTLDRWNKPQLDNVALAPDWIYVSRQGVVVNPALPDATSNTSANFVLGRIAYNIYDVGGLLDANVAGYPSGVSAADVGRKGSTAFARLQALGMTQAQVEALLDFRNAATQGDYANYARNHTLHKGFTHTAAGDNRFFSRQELIRFAMKEGFTDQLPNLTIFSREKNAPTYSPATTTPTNPNLAIARHIASGRLLYEKRFPLNKIELLANPEANASDIKSYFGLEYDSTSRRFTYVGQGTSVQGSIKTLAQIGAESAYRQPDFFETLKAVILEGSLGQSAGATASTASQNSADFQVIRIGACIIDQYDADYIPIPIYFESTADVPVWGVENLPYFNKLQYIGQNPNIFGIFSPAQGAAVNNTLDGTDYYFRWAVELWNPHIQKYPIETNPNHPDYVPDVNIRVELGPVGAEARVDIHPNATATEDPLTRMGTPNPISTAEHSQQFSISGASLNPATNATKQHYFMDPRQVFFGEVNDGPIIRDAGNSASYSSATLAIVNPVYVDLHVVGHDGFLHHYFRSWKIRSPLSMKTSPSYVTSFMLSDPRTNRMGLFDVDWRATTVIAGQPSYPSGTAAGSRYAWPIRIDASTVPSDSVKSTGTMSGGSAYSGSDVRPALLFENTVSATQFADPDGEKRMGDGGFDPSANAIVPTRPLNPAVANPPPDPAGNPSRPRILNRPFHSVGELGYVFRDAAWKTLNFSSTDSADIGLLDVFSLHEEEFISGKISINSPHTSVWQALLVESTKVEGSIASNINSSQANTLATAITDYLANASNSPFDGLPDFVTRFSTPSLLDVDGFGSAANRAIKTQREAVVRSLAGSVQSRTWNVLIDLVAQNGRVPSTAAALDNFVVEGEVRCWLHLAIDRYTGEIIDEQLEFVSE